MKRIFLLAVGLGILGIAFFTQVTKAQVYSEFESVTLTNHTYIELERPTPLDFREFGLPPTFEPDNYRNGYYKQPIDLPFEFKYGDHTYTQIWVNVNGFAMFLRPGELPPFVAPDEPIGLFRASASYPKNVLAPYWGDHYYRSVLDEPFNYLVSQISYQNINNEEFVIQWKDLNINFDDDPSDNVTNPIKSSVGNFQLHLFKSENYPDNKQGRIEFAYGVVGGNPDTVSGNRVITRGAAVGIKGESSDYLNGLFYNQPHYLAYTSEDFTIKWPPSGGTDWRITFVPKKTVSMDSTWGDGDADLSQAPGNLHGGLPQSRFVTANDVRMILHAVATDTPLDSAYGRNAYHADVNHNGRYYFPFVDTTLKAEDGITDSLVTNIYRTDIPWKDDYPEEYLDSLKWPLPGSVRNSLYFQATEYDAGRILWYLGGKVTKLPWIIDTNVQHGKIGVYDHPATGIEFGNVIALEGNTYKVPVYLNGQLHGDYGVRLDLNGEVLDISGNNNATDYNNSRVVIAGVIEGDDYAKPLCFVTVKTDANEISATNIRLNDKPADDYSQTLLSVDIDDNENTILKQNVPNPFIPGNGTQITVNIPSAGNYKLAVYDMLGNEVMTLHEGNLTAGYHNFDWKGIDASGSEVQSGMYIYRLSGDGLTVSRKMVITK